MKDQSNKQTTKNEQTAKKVWQTPTIETLSHDTVQSGAAAGATEGGPTKFHIDSYHS